MHPLWEKVERWNRRLVPLALVLLLVVILYGFVGKEGDEVEALVHLLDLFVIVVFVIDLIFLAIHARSWRFFFRNYWLDILAVFPFGLFLKSVESLAEGTRALERFFGSERVVVGERLVVGQEILHEAVEVEKEAKVVGKAERLAKGFRGFGRGLRFAAKSRIFQALVKPRKRR